MRNRKRKNSNNIKQGLVWIYLNKKYDKSIGIEWSLRFNPFNCFLKIDGREGRYVISFWLIFVFYISFEGIFKKYPKEWNSVANNRKGGYIESAVRYIGITQYGWNHICFCLWHDGESDSILIKIK